MSALTEKLDDACENFDARQDIYAANQLRSAVEVVLPELRRLEQDNARLRAGWPVVINCPTCGIRHEFHLHPDNDVDRAEEVKG